MRWESILRRNSSTRQAGPTASPTEHRTPAVVPAFSAHGTVAGGLIPPLCAGLPMPPAGGPAVQAPTTRTTRPALDPEAAPAARQGAGRLGGREGRPARQRRAAHAPAAWPGQPLGPAGGSTAAALVRGGGAEAEFAG